MDNRDSFDNVKAKVSREGIDGVQAQVNVCVMVWVIYGLSDVLVRKCISIYIYLGTYARMHVFN